MATVIGISITISLPLKLEHFQSVISPHSTTTPCVHEQYLFRIDMPIAVLNFQLSHEILESKKVAQIGLIAFFLVI